MKIYLKVLFVISVLVLAFLLVFSKYGMFRSDKQFAYRQASEITRVEIEKDSLKTTLEEKSGEWLINGEHVANKEMIDNLKVVISKLKAEYPLPKLYSEVITDSLIKKQGMRFRIFNGNSLERSYYLLPSDSLDCVGLIEGKRQLYCLYLPGYTVNISDYLSANPSFWLNNILFSYYPDDIISVEVVNRQQPSQSFRLEHNERQNYKLIDLAQIKVVKDVDTMAVRRYLTYFNTITFDSYADMSEEEKHKILASDYPYILTVETKKEKISCRIMYMPVSDDELDAYGNPLKYNRQQFYLSKNNGKDIAIASWLTFDILLKNLSDFVNK